MSIPSDWPDWQVPDNETLAKAESVALAACDWAATPDHRAAPIARYYSENGFAGNLFSVIGPNDPDDIAAPDLIATTMLSVTITPSATRRILLPGDYRDSVLEALAAVHDATSITDASADVWRAAERLYLAARDALGVRPWVTASKLVARKRPHLLPVRDSVVAGLLRPGLSVDYQQDWFVIRHLMRQPDLRSSLDGLRAIVEGGGPERAEPHDLRLLDVALWMYGVQK